MPVGTIRTVVWAQVGVRRGWWVWRGRRRGSGGAEKVGSGIEKGSLGERVGDRGARLVRSVRTAVYISGGSIEILNTCTAGDLRYF